MLDLKIQNEDKEQVVRLDASEVNGWLNIWMEENESEEHFGTRLQQEIELQINRPDYNIWHRETRHLGYSKAKPDENGIYPEEPLMNELRDPSIYIKDQLDREQRWEYEACCQWFRDNFKPAQADMLIAIILDDCSIDEYARRIGDNPNNVSHRFVRAKKKLKKVYEERPISASPVANQWEGRHSHKQKGGN